MFARQQFSLQKTSVASILATRLRGEREPGMIAVAFFSHVPGRFRSEFERTSKLSGIKHWFMLGSPATISLYLCRDES
jgi:hypothetical protein